MVWRSFDGQVDLSTLIDELAGATGLGREVIAAQVVDWPGISAAPDT
jgi:hypothetical protein